MPIVRYLGYIVVRLIATSKLHGFCEFNNQLEPRDELSAVAYINCYEVCGTFLSHCLLR